jgi:hypothetical protein
MNKEQFAKVKASVIEVVGFIGVIGSLMFVGVQIRQNTIASRASAYQQMGAAVAEIWFNTAQDPARALMTMRFFEEANAKFTPAEEAVLINQSIAALRQHETTWRQIKLGLLDPDALDAFGWNAEGSTAFSINLRRLWPRIAPHMSPDFRTYLEETLFPKLTPSPSQGRP